MTNQLNKVLESINNLQNTPPIHVTKQQYDALDAMVVAYMSVASLGLDKDAQIAIMKPMDMAWDKLVVKKEDE